MFWQSGEISFRARNAKTVCVCACTCFGKWVIDGKMYKHCIIIVVFLSFSVSFLYAQSGQNTQDSGAIDEPRVTVLPPAYNPQMMRLSEILGALHYLRELCGAKEGQKWREQMQAMLEAEQPIAERRAQMIARFNRGFRGFQETYRECTNAAILANNRYISEGAKLAGEIPGRYGR